MNPRIREIAEQADEFTDAERLQKIREWSARNVWNSPELAEQDHPDNNTYYGA